MPSHALGVPYESAPLVRAIAAALHRLGETPPCLAVAVSGGPDSSMLAVQAAIFARRQDMPLHLLHVHHGLQEPAGLWQAQVHDLAQMLGVACHSVRVEVNESCGDGIESAARDARYAALEQLADRIGVKHVLLAHHRNDQAETVLLRLLRGAGPTGLAAMAPLSRRGSLVYLRPWLDIDRAVILSAAGAFSEAKGWEPVVDPTNAQDRYTRAALRQRLAPLLDQRWPGWQATLARHARLSAEMAQIVEETSAADFAALDPSSDARSFSLAAWRMLSPPRQALVLRYWLARLGERMPSDARLQDLMRQLRGLHALGHDRQMRLKHGAVCVVCIRGRVTLESV